ncbi:MAG: glucose-1-phosphate cytidylyltransferase [Prochlorococcaceae cyanobacterium]
MKAVILAGGLGTRLSEETHLRPKPMVEIGGRPILWHILKIYSHYGINDFVICCGYKGYVIKEYFANYVLHSSDVTLRTSDGHVEIHRRPSEAWNVTLVDTGEVTNTGGRLRRVAEHLDDETFCFTYGDGVADVDLNALIGFHRNHGLSASVTAVQPPGRYGRLQLEADQRVSGFVEKPQGDGDWINGGFFVLEPGVIKAIEGDDTSWELGPLQRLAATGELAAWKHHGFWQPMDTLRDHHQLEALWQSGQAPWKLWP